MNKNNSNYFDDIDMDLPITESVSQLQEDFNRETICAITGSFDPFTKGHMWLVEQALKIFDKVYVVIGYNVDKNRAFSIDISKTFIEKCFVETPVEVITIQNDILVHKLVELGVTHLVKGLRNSEDFNYEKNISNINKQLSDKIETIYFNTPKELEEVSSSAIKHLLQFRDSFYVVEKMLPEQIYFDVLFEYIRKLPTFYNRNSFEVDHYRKPGRYYHNLFHIHFMLKEFEKVKYNFKLAMTNYEFEEAIFYHDYHYDVESTLEYFRSRVFKPASMTVSLIEFTKYEREPKTEDEKLFHDLDFYILGCNEKMYDYYKRMVKKEYLENITEEEYNTGRKDFLTELLENKIFQTEYYSKYEAQARENINRELSELK